MSFLSLVANGENNEESVEKNVFVITMLDDIDDLISHYADTYPLCINFPERSVVVISSKNWCMPDLSPERWGSLDHPILKKHFIVLLSPKYYMPLKKWMTEVLKTNELYVIFPSCDLENDALENVVEVRRAEIAGIGDSCHIEYIPVVSGKSRYVYSCKTNTWQLQNRVYSNL